MKKFRVLSDLHLDPELNGNYPFSIRNKKIFTVLCGDVAGQHEYGYDWIAKNMTSGIIVSGNHMPYNYEDKTMQEQREELAAKYPMSAPITYLDVETGHFKKEVDGILFIGTCMYSDMKITHSGNPDGDVTVNKMISHRHMNDYRFGIKEKVYDFGIDNDPRLVRITPTDYEEWFANAFEKIEAELVANESSSSPKPVVLVTHYPLIKKLLENSFYDSVDKNFASYGSDKEEWIKSHPSIKCYCCGHVHDIAPEYRNYKLQRDNGSYCLVVNNARGYVRSGHDFNFNPNVFVNVETWEVEKIQESKATIERKKKAQQQRLAMMSLFW